MTREECIALLNRYAEYKGMGIHNLAGCREAMRMAAELLSQPSLPSNLDEAAEDKLDDAAYNWVMDNFGSPKESLFQFDCRCFQAGAEWMAGQGWIDDGSMPRETKQECDTLQGHKEWTESNPVLAWDSVYGCRVDFTRDGKWMSEQRGGYTGQICHGIIAWRPIPEYKEKQ